jgi:SAM-dependent methyltransferase
MANRPQTPVISPGPVIMSPAQAQAIFDANAHITEVQYAAHRKGLKQFVETANLQPTDTVLDLGCGVGWNARLAAPRCRYVIGIDISQLSLEKAVMGASDIGLTNVAFGHGDITDAYRLRQAVNQAKTWTTTLLNTPAAVYRHPSDITPRVPTAIAQKFHVIFLCWVMHIMNRETQRNVLSLLRDHFLLPGGRILVTWATPKTRMAFIAVGLGLRGPDGVHSRTGTTLHEYVGHRRDVDDADTDLRDVVHGLGFQVDSCGVFPDWHRLDHVRDATLEVRAHAQKLSQLANPAGEWLEIARQERYGQLPSRLRGDAAYDFVKSVQRADEECDIVPFHSVASVLAVLSFPAPS